MDVHLIDGTYELFRHYYAVPSALDEEGTETGAVRGVLTSMLGMIEGGATHIGVATDHVIESFRNDLYAGYKTSAGIPETLFAQFPILEEALENLGLVVWPMVRYEADDGLASAACNASQDERVKQVMLCTPDKDLAQCVKGERVVQFDRRRRILLDEDGIVGKWGVRPESIPDLLALTGDSADGYPGLRGWGLKSAAQMLSHYGHLERIPKDWRKWEPKIRGAERLCAVLLDQWEDVLLYRTLATLVCDVPLFEEVEELRWCGPRPEFEQTCRRMRLPAMYERAVEARRHPRKAEAAYSG